MADHNDTELAEVFEGCLAKMEEGYTIEEVLASFPDYIAEMRPLLETAGAAQGLHDPEVPRAARHRSRTRALVHAARLRSAPRGRFSGLNLRRLVIQLGAFALVIAVSLTSLVAVSAQSLPGDSLYVIKRVAESARLNSSNSQARSNLTESLRIRRIDEIEELLRLRRAASVNFEGVVTALNEGNWEIAGLTLRVGPEAEVIGDILPGMFVEVFGRTLSSGELVAEQIFLRAYAFAGRLEARNGSIWLVDSVPVLITDQTQLAPGIALGDQIIILASVDDDGTISARAVLYGQEVQPQDGTGDQAAPGTGTPAPAVTPTLEGLETTETEAVETESEFEHGTETQEAEATGDGEDNGGDDGEVNSGSSSDTEEDSEDNSGSGSNNSGSGSENSGPGSSDDDETKTPEPTETPEPTKTEKPDDD